MTQTHQRAAEQSSDLQPLLDGAAERDPNALMQLQALLGNGFLAGPMGLFSGLGGWLRDLLESLGISGEQGPGEGPGEGPENTPPEEPTPPPIDLTKYGWLVTIWGKGGLDSAGAEALLRLATPEQLALAENPAASTLTAQSPQVPAADLGTHSSNRARPLDWDAAPGAGHISPETPTGQTTGGVGGQTMNDTFEQHRAALLTREFGEGVTEAQVQGAIQLATALGRADVAAALQARLFRAAQYAAVETLNVEDSGRYQPGGGNTFCNIYAYDMVTALGAYIPRTWWYDTVIARIQGGAEVVSVAEYARRANAGEPVRDLIRPVYGETVREMNANSLNTWMQSWGASFGWTEAADMATAQAEANSGKVAVLLASNKVASAPGHISVILAERDDHSATKDKDGNVTTPLQSQAGGSNFKYGTGSQWWQNSSHTDGAAWINSGSGHSPILTPEELGR